MKMSSAEFLDMSHPVDTLKWQLPIVERTTGGKGSLFGGVGLAAGVVALEQATGKPAIWATGQYLSLTQQPETLDLQVVLPAVGRNVTQGRVVGQIGEREIITVLGACGQRPNEVQGMWQPFPEVPEPEECDLLVRDDMGSSLHQWVEIRLIKGMFGFSGQGEPSHDGSSLFWARMPKVAHDPGALAIIADYMPSSLGNALGRVMHCTSIDNTIRFANPVESEWVLCENRIVHVAEGFGYGMVHMWSEQGILLATAGQSMIVRVPQPA
ncbi:MAG: thioesterase family protein [Pseudomonadales bacterium]|nr:thioesterase family protein [Pseudomonadales bacterium]